MNKKVKVKVPLFVEVVAELEDDPNNEIIIQKTIRQILENNSFDVRECRLLNHKYESTLEQIKHEIKCVDREELITEIEAMNGWKSVNSRYLYG